MAERPPYPNGSTPFSERVAQQLTPVSVGNVVYERIRDEILRWASPGFREFGASFADTLRPMAGVSLMELQQQVVLACLRDMWQAKLIDIAVVIRQPFSKSTIYLRKL